MSLRRDQFRDWLLKSEQTLVNIESQLRLVRKKMAEMEELLACEEQEALRGRS